MDKKSSNTGISKSLLKSLNRPYIGEPVKDDNKISELMSKFINGELDTINNILESNEILNFKNSTGETLIHAIIKNESPNISEENKLYIIQKLVDKNVSLNSMTQLNQNPLHMACQKGYTDIIHYLLTNGCDQKLNDNNGNAPIHYLIEKFIETCKQDDFYKQSNQNIKSINSDQIKNIDEILKIQNINILLNLLGKQSDNKGNEYYCILDGIKITHTIENFIKNRTQYMLPNIYTIINNKLDDINKIFIEPIDSHENKLEKAKNIILNTQDEIKKIYDYNLDNDSILWDNFIQNQKINIITNKTNYVEKINENIKNILENFQDIKNRLDSITTNCYDDIIKYVSGVYFIYDFMKGNLITDVLRDSAKNPIMWKNDPSDLLEPDKPIYIGTTVIITQNKIHTPILINNGIEPLMFFCNSGVCDINKIEQIKSEILDYFLIENSKSNKFKTIINYGDSIDDIILLNKSINLSNAYFDYNGYEQGIPYFKGLFMNDNTLNGTQFHNSLFYGYFLPGSENDNASNSTIISILDSRFDNSLQSKIINLPADIDIDAYDANINENFLSNEKFHFKYDSIRILKETINNYIESLENIIRFSEKNDEIKFKNFIQQLNIFFIKEFTNVLIKIINNSVILEKYISEINTMEFLNLNKHYGIILQELLPENIMANFLNKIIKDTNIENSTLFGYIREKKYIKEIERIYDRILKIFGIFKELTENINKYQAMFQLEKYNEHVENNINEIFTTNIELDNTIFNDYIYDIRKKFPENFIKYKTEYFDIKKDINLYGFGQRDDLILTKNIYINNDILIANTNYKKKIIENIFPYVNTFNFNIFYMKPNDISYYKLDIYGTDASTSTNIKYSDNPNIDELNFINNESIYNFNNFESSAGKYEFARGFDTIMTLIDVGVNGKEEKNTLCKIIKKCSKNNKTLDPYSDSDSVMESDTKNAKFCVENNLIFNNTNIKNTFLITQNLDELINLIVFWLYKILIKSKHSDIFFMEQSDIEYTQITNPSITKNFKVGINLDYSYINDSYKKNIMNTLTYIKNIPTEKSKYIIDNIKIFVKLIISSQITDEMIKIFKEIKISYKNPSTKQKIIGEITIKQINIFNEKISNLASKLNNSENYISKIISNSTISPVLKYNQIINIVKNNQIDNNNIKIIGTKCVNKRKTTELLNINFNYKILDVNGNTIITRLIDQFNLYGIEQIMADKNKIFLKTYKNNKQQTPIDYLMNLILNIQNEYSKLSLNQRINKYSTMLSNSMESSGNFKGIEFDNSNNLMNEIIINSIYLFNEVIWLKLYDYPKGWNLTDKNKLKNILGIIKEELLITSFDSTSDMEVYINNEKEHVPKNIHFFIKKIQNEIANLEHTKSEYKSEIDLSKNGLINSTDISDKIIEIDKLIVEKQKMVDNYINYANKMDNKIENYTDISVEKILKKYKSTLIKSTKINWDQYEIFSDLLDNNYYKIIKILNKKIENTNTISNFLFNIINNNVSQNDSEKFEMFEKYFDLIFDNMFADYWDLDRFEDSTYNVLNESIINILKINVIGIITNELSNTIINYIIQTKNYNDTIMSEIKNIKNDKEKINSIKSFLFLCMITKLELKNPDKTSYQNIDIQKKTIIEQLNITIGGRFDEQDKIELDKILEFNKFLCENIAYNCYQELIKILFDTKKISIYYKMFKLLKE